MCVHVLHHTPVQQVLMGTSRSSGAFRLSSDYGVTWGPKTYVHRALRTLHSAPCTLHPAPCALRFGIRCVHAALRVHVRVRCDF